MIRFHFYQHFTSVNRFIIVFELFINFSKLEKTIDVLLEVRSENPRLHVDLGTVISNLNLHHLDDIEDWVHARGIESYRHEIAEQRAEFHNLGDPITPPPEVYVKSLITISETYVNLSLPSETDVKPYIAIRDTCEISHHHQRHNVKPLIAIRDIWETSHHHQRHV